MRLDVLFGGLPWETVCGTPDKDVKALVYHSDKTVPASAFFAISGEERDGREYLEQAAALVAQILVTDEHGEQMEKLLGEREQVYALLQPDFGSVMLDLKAR